MVRGCLEVSKDWEAGESVEAEKVFTLTCGLNHLGVR
jgi:hypothetical protein